MNAELQDATAALSQSLAAAAERTDDAESLDGWEGTIRNAPELLQSLADWHAALCRDEARRAALEERATLVERITAADTPFGRAAAEVTRAFGDRLWRGEADRPAAGVVRAIIAGADENNRSDPVIGQPVVPRIRQRKQLLDLRGAVTYEIEHVGKGNGGNSLRSLLQECDRVIDSTAGLRVDECYWLWSLCSDTSLAKACLTAELTGRAMLPFLQSGLELLEDGSLQATTLPDAKPERDATPKKATLYERKHALDVLIAAGMSKATAYRRCSSYGPMVPAEDVELMLREWQEDEKKRERRL